MDRFATNFPNVTAMLCSGGGSRVDFEALRRFHTFWASDRTDPRDRVFIQWGYSHFYPASAIAAHVTRMGNRPFKFTLDVAMSGALGFDVDWQKLSPDQRAAAVAAVKLYKEELRPIVQRGDLYRIVSPYGGQRAAFNFVSEDSQRTVLFVYQIGNGNLDPVKPQGLDPHLHYRIREVNLQEGTQSALPNQDQIIDGSTLMREGLTPYCTKEFDSSVIEFTAEK
jgi:alpha-galactosidase